MSGSAPALQPAFIPDELIAEILSLLSVKNIVQLKCVSKSWNTLISDLTFVQKHFKKSSQNHPHLIFTPQSLEYPMSSVKSFPVCHLLENPSITVSGENCHGSMDICEIVGSCNGLLCLLFNSNNKKYEKYWFCLWNPVTGARSEEFGILYHINPLYPFDSLMFNFGCDILTGTYKVVVRGVYQDEEEDSPRRYRVRIFSFGGSFWRDINSFPLIPLSGQYNNGVYLSGTINWFALRNYSYSIYDFYSVRHVDQFVIVSLDISTETYSQFLLPPGFRKVPVYPPTLQVLMDCLCFSHDFKGIEFVIWQMKEFGVQESWTRLFRVDYFYLEMRRLPLPKRDPWLLPLYLSKNGDTIILVNCEDDQTIIYNQREKRVQRIKSSNKVCWFSSVESLISSFNSLRVCNPDSKHIQCEEEEEEPLLSEDLDEDGDELSNNDSSDD